jgi:PAS domain S-box-containing protein
MTEIPKGSDPKKGCGTEGDLRARAEAQANGDRSDEVGSPDDESAGLSHELRVHQIELEMQNEELRRALDDLETSRARYFDLYDLAPVGFCTLDEVGIVHEANLTAARMLGVTKDKLIGKPLTDFIDSASQDAFYQHRRRLQDLLAPQAFELRLLRSSQPGFWAWVEIQAARNAEGAFACRVAFTDITLLRQPQGGGAKLDG